MYRNSVIHACMIEIVLILIGCWKLKVLKSFQAKLKMAYVSSENVHTVYIKSRTYLILGDQ